ncbi:MAG: hypothetical protein HY847_01290 [Betaproteobacteria bacterium]|nr:hypothetical protein [Betaproteobacteria bacterium]
MAFDVKGEILSAIGKTDDPNIKAVLLLMLGVLEEIGGKIDSMMSDEVRKAVLNGHESVHNEHHVWIAERMAEDCSSACTWARGKMEAEAEAEKEAKADKRTARDAAIRQVVTMLVGAALGVIGMFLLR